MKDANGYVRLYDEKPGPANWNQFYYEHRKVIEDTLKRKLLREEVIHHIDHNRSNNTPDNLKVITDKSKHVLEEHPEWIKKKRF